MSHSRAGGDSDTKPSANESIMRDASGERPTAARAAGTSPEGRGEPSPQPGSAPPDTAAGDPGPRGWWARWPEKILRAAMLITVALLLVAAIVTLLAFLRKT